MRLIRPAQESDYPFIYATWLRSQYYGSPWFKKVEKDSFFDNYKLFIKRRLETSTVLVSCLFSDPDVVLGYVVYTGENLHWVYVKRAWRQMGIAKEMVPSNITRVTSLTKMGDIASKGVYPFNPFK